MGVYEPEFARLSRAFAVGIIAVLASAVVYVSLLVIAMTNRPLYLQLFNTGKAVYRIVANVPESFDGVESHSIMN